MPSPPPRAWSVGGSQVKRAEAFGMEGVEVDGHDFFAVYEAARDVIAKARDGGGPSLMHVKLNRYFGHFEGDAMTYRPDGEVEGLRQQPRQPADLPPAGDRDRPAGAAELDEIDRRSPA